VTSRSSEADVPQKIFSIEEMSALIIYKSAPELFSIEQVSSQVYTPKWQPQDIRPMFCKSNNCQLCEDIQILPPKLQEIIYKHNLAIKLRQRAYFKTAFVS